MYYLQGDIKDRLKIKKIVNLFQRFFIKVNHDGWFYVGKRCKIVNRKSVYFGKGVQIASDCLIYLNNKSCRVTIGDNSYIGMFSRIATNNKIAIGKNVITGPNVFIANYNHEYRDINKPISDQGTSGDNNIVVIGDDCWIGTHVCIVGNIRIGKHCVIGANSVVTKDVPDYCVVVGTPARVIKKYNFKLKKWEKINSKV